MSLANRPNRKRECRDYFLVGTAMLLMVLGSVLDFGQAGIGLAITAMPVGAFLVVGHIPGRGAALACLGLALGTVLIPSVFAVMTSWEYLAVVAGMASAAIIGGGLADRMAQDVPGSINQGRWVHVYVESQGPNDTTGRPVRPKVSPHSPERRALTRLTLPLGRSSRR